MAADEQPTASAERDLMRRTRPHTSTGVVGAIGLGASAAWCVVFTYSFASAWLRRGAPFVPTAQKKIEAIFAPGGLLSVSAPSLRRSTARVVDLGSGGGALVRAAVRQGGFGCAVGYEINPGLLAMSKLCAFGSRREQFRLQSLWAADLSAADVVFVYGVPFHAH
jgi:hypothetical protein